MSNHTPTCSVLVNEQCTLLAFRAIMSNRAL
jgi:hypothetical protein